MAAAAEAVVVADLEAAGEAEVVSVVTGEAEAAAADTTVVRTVLNVVAEAEDLVATEVVTVAALAATGEEVVVLEVTGEAAVASVVTAAVTGEEEAALVVTDQGGSQPHPFKPSSRESDVF